MCTDTDRPSELAKKDPKRQFFSIAHWITPEKMYAAFLNLRKETSAGVDGVTYEEYEKDAARNIRQLHGRLKGGKYRAQPPAPGLYPKGKRETETNLDSRPRGQDLAESVEGFITDVQP
jgi:hypothetical protein